MHSDVGECDGTPLRHPSVLPSLETLPHLSHQLCPRRQQGLAAPKSLNIVLGLMSPAVIFPVQR